MSEQRGFIVSEESDGFGILVGVVVLCFGACTAIICAACLLMVLWNAVYSICTSPMTLIVAGLVVTTYYLLKWGLLLLHVKR